MGQDYLASGLQSVVTATNEINLQLEKRAQTLRSLFSTKEVLPENHEVSTRLEKRDGCTCSDVAPLGLVVPSMCAGNDTNLD